MNERPGPCPAARRPETPPRAAARGLGLAFNAPGAALQRHPACAGSVSTPAPATPSNTRCLVMPRTAPPPAHAGSLSMPAPRCHRAATPPHTAARSCERARRCLAVSRAPCSLRRPGPRAAAALQRRPAPLHAGLGSLSTPRLQRRFNPSNTPTPLPCNATCCAAACARGLAFDAPGPALPPPCNAARGFRRRRLALCHAAAPPAHAPMSVRGFGSSARRRAPLPREFRRPAPHPVPRHCTARRRAPPPRGFRCPAPRPALRPGRTPCALPCACVGSASSSAGVLHPRAGFDARRPRAGFDARRPRAGFDARRPRAGFDARRPRAGLDVRRRTLAAPHARSLYPVPRRCTARRRARFDVQRRALAAHAPSPAAVHHPRAGFDAWRHTLCRAAAPPAAVHLPARVLMPGAAPWPHPARAPMSVRGFGFVIRRRALGFDARRCWHPARVSTSGPHPGRIPCTLPRPPPCTTRAGFNARRRRHRPRTLP
ncbi:hypothetical protein GGX14DRAFT_568525 [Mycena pura]|uniref:Uncharacterized protein n=1 Tax=Mycena pura TaxID=153505 RepID=A0AAD6VCV3_9AGAR|nr:hypothetical protein GGX14DRAFT_568525 [Mycena pura]